MISEAIFSKTQALFNSGAIDKARTLAKTRDTRPLSDPAVHRAWADLLEELEMFEDMIMELNLVMRDDPREG